MKGVREASKSSAKILTIFKENQATINFWLIGLQNKHQYKHAKNNC
jgi:hypothetical protein